MPLSRKLETALRAPAMLATAVSGGVDSLTLTAAAYHARGGRGLAIYHAVSPAVPREATERVRRHAARLDVRLEIVDAGEFADPNYLRNPINRCFYCKTNLYSTISRLVQERDAVIASGTNTDDLGDYRPGLNAARDYGIVHPFVEADMDKAAVRDLARKLGLDDIAELPAAPCLSSRIETGQVVHVPVLNMIDEVERMVRHHLGQVTVRCRMRAEGIFLELDGEVLDAMAPLIRRTLQESIHATAQRHGFDDLPVSFETYQQGSAFLHA